MAEPKVTVAEKEMVIEKEDGTVETVLGTITTTDHGETDKDGNPKISVNIGVSPIEEK